MGQPIPHLGVLNVDIAGHHRARSVFKVGGTHCSGLEEDKTARICGDYKLTVNQVSKL